MSSSIDEEIEELLKRCLYIDNIPTNPPYYEIDKHLKYLRLNLSFKATDGINAFKDLFEKSGRWIAYKLVIYKEKETKFILGNELIHLIHEDLLNILYNDNSLYKEKYLSLDIITNKKERDSLINNPYFNLNNLFKLFIVGRIYDLSNRSFPLFMDLLDDTEDLFNFVDSKPECITIDKIKIALSLFCKKNKLEAKSIFKQYKRFVIGKYENEEEISIELEKINKVYEFEKELLENGIEKSRIFSTKILDDLIKHLSIKSEVVTISPVLMIDSRYEKVKEWINRIESNPYIQKQMLEQISKVNYKFFEKASEITNQNYFDLCMFMLFTYTDTYQEFFSKVDLLIETSNNQELIEHDGLNIPYQGYEKLLKKLEGREFKEQVNGNILDTSRRYDAVKLIDRMDLAYQKTVNKNLLGKMKVYFLPRLSFICRDVKSYEEVYDKVNSYLNKKVKLKEKKF